MPMKPNGKKLRKMERSLFSDSTRMSKQVTFRDDEDDLEWINQITECPVYKPSFHDFQDPLLYIHNIAPHASKYGVCKIVPPVISSTPPGVIINKEKPGFKFTPKVQPLRVSSWTTNDKTTFLISNKSYTLRDFEVMANRVTANKYCLSGSLPSAYVEREFWFEMTRGKKGTVEYGVNVDGSAFSSSSNDQLGNSKWNLKKLPRLPRSALRLMEDDVPGVTDPMLYIGMLFSMFAWHVEDHYLYSINYHHCGAPKTWYGVPGSAADEFEKVIQHHVYTREILSTDGPNGAFEMLADKTTMFPPKILLQNHVPVYKLVQLPGEFVITFPRAYHAGFSHGFNCGEAVNFADHDWFPFGGEANERYALLKKKPVIPYEEILCKEMLISSKAPIKEYTCDAAAAPDRFVKASFASLIRKYDNAILWLKSLDQSLGISSNLKETISCSLCKRDCYVAHVKCNCRPDPICVFHDTELSDCCCGANRFLYMRRDLPKMNDVAKKCEEEEKSLQKGKKLKKHENYSSHGCKRFHKRCNGFDRVECADSKTQRSNARKSMGSRKQRTCTGKNNAKVDVATPVIKGNLKNSSPPTTWQKRTRLSRRLKEVQRTSRKKASCHFCCSRIAH